MIDGRMNILKIEEVSWNARKIKDSLLKENVLNSVKILVLTIISRDDLEVKLIKECDIEKNKMLIESLDIEKCKIKYIARFWGYYAVGETELDVYLEILKKVGNKNSIRYPIC